MAQTKKDEHYSHQQISAVRSYWNARITVCASHSQTHSWWKVTIKNRRKLGHFNSAVHQSSSSLCENVFFCAIIRLHVHVRVALCINDSIRSITYLLIRIVLMRFFVFVSLASIAMRLKEIVKIHRSHKLIGMPNWWIESNDLSPPKNNEFLVLIFLSFFSPSSFPPLSLSLKPF